MNSQSSYKPATNPNPKVPVDSTTHISFDEDTRTFRIICGQSIYCFCIGHENDLVHLYWGPYVENFDIRFQFQKIRKNHYTTHSVPTSASHPREYNEPLFDIELPKPIQQDPNTDIRKNNLLWRARNKVRNQLLEKLEEVIVGV